MSDFRAFQDYEVKVRIRNNYVIVTSEDYSIHHYGGTLENFSLEKIGSAVMLCFPVPFVFEAHQVSA